MSNNASDLTYTGSWGTGALAYLQYFQYLFLMLEVDETGQLVLQKGREAVFNFYRTGDGRYLLQNQEDGRFVTGTLITSDGQPVMRYDATADAQGATSFAVAFSQSGKPVRFTDDQGYTLTYYIDAYPWNPGLTEYQVPYGRTSVPDGYGDELYLSRWFAPTLDADTLNGFLADRGDGEPDTARVVRWRYVETTPFDLGGWHFAGCSWNHAVIGASNLAQSRLVMCDLADAQMAGTDLGGAELIGGRFDGVDMTALGLDGVSFVHQLGGRPTPFSFQGATLEISLLGKDWSYCNLKGAILPDLVPGMRLANLEATGATLDGQNLEEAILGGAVFRGASLVDVNLTGASLTRADFSPDANGRFADLTGAGFNGADLTNANLQNARLVSCNFASANLEAADLTSAQLGGEEQEVGAAFSYAYMANTVLAKTNLYAANFSNATFYGPSASVAGASTLEQAHFGDAYLAGLDLSGGNLRGATFDDACLVNCSLAGTDLGPSEDGSAGASLVGACLQGADFTGADLSGANLHNATVAFDNGSITVQHCDGYGHLTPSAPVTFGATTGLDCNSVKSDTICPNGSTLEDNLQNLGVASCEDLSEDQWRQILTAPDPQTSWVAVSCGRSEAEDA